MAGGVIGFEYGNCMATERVHWRKPFSWLGTSCPLVQLSSNSCNFNCMYHHSPVRVNRLSHGRVHEANNRGRGDGSPYLHRCHSQETPDEKHRRWGDSVTNQQHIEHLSRIAQQFGTEGRDKEPSNITNLTQLGTMLH